MVSGPGCRIGRRVDGDQWGLVASFGLFAHVVFEHGGSGWFGQGIMDRTFFTTMNRPVPPACRCGVGACEIPATRLDSPLRRLLLLPYLLIMSPLPQVKQQRESTRRSDPYRRQHADSQASRAKPPTL